MALNWVPQVNIENFRLDPRTSSMDGKRASMKKKMSLEHNKYIKNHLDMSFSSVLSKKFEFCNLGLDRKTLSMDTKYASMDMKIGMKLNEYMRNHKPISFS